MSQKEVIEAVERFLKEIIIIIIIIIIKIYLKPFHFAGDFDLNFLAHVKCSKVHKFSIQKWYYIKHKQVYSSNKENGYSK